MYRERTKAELNEMKETLIHGKAIAECHRSDAMEICYGYCSMFDTCWKYDYSKTLEEKVK